MNDQEIKVKLFHKIDSLGHKRLLELYGIVTNFLNSNDSSDDWNNLTASQKEGIEYGIEELEEGKGLGNNVVMDELKKKYGII